MSDNLIKARNNPLWIAKRTIDGWTVPYNTKTEEFLCYGTHDWVALLNKHNEEIAAYEDEIDFLVRSGEEKDELINQLTRGK